MRSSELSGLVRQWQEDCDSLTGTLLDSVVSALRSRNWDKELLDETTLLVGVDLVWSHARETASFDQQLKDFLEWASASGSLLVEARARGFLLTSYRDAKQIKRLSEIILTHPFEAIEAAASLKIARLDGTPGATEAIRWA